MPYAPKRDTQEQSKQQRFNKTAKPSPKGGLPGQGKTSNIRRPPNRKNTPTARPR